MKPYRVALAIRTADGTRRNTHGAAPGRGWCRRADERPDGTRVRVRGVEPGTGDADVLVSATLAVHQLVPDLGSEGNPVREEQLPS
jgi:hypothetical protein